MQKVLVAYFSCSGVTKKLAQTLAGVVKGDLYEITPSSVEMRDKSLRPAISGSVKDFAQYDTVFVGFPIWWYVAPTIINTFLESKDFSGKTVIPFATSGGSGVGDTDKYLHPSCSEQTAWRPAKRFAGSAGTAELQKWVEGLKL